MAVQGHSRLPVKASRFRRQLEAFTKIVRVPLHTGLGSTIFSGRGHFTRDGPTFLLAEAFLGRSFFTKNSTRWVSIRPSRAATSRLVPERWEGTELAFPGGQEQ